MRQIAAALPPDLPEHIGVAVSGGSDSLALLTLLHRFTQQRDIALSAVTVDHGLRPESAAEAVSVAQYAAQLNIPHDTLNWTGWEGAGNTQNEARKARYALMSDWAQTRHIPAIALGHTLDDQAETVLMRLSRGAGVDGLSAMRGDVDREGVRWLRPLLGVRREALREILRARAIHWQDDPSNDDNRYDRIKARQALALLAPLGVTTEALAQVAENMQAARNALDARTREVANRLVSVEAGALKFQRASFESLEPEIARRLVLAGLKWITGADYAPRARSLAATLEALRRDASATLEGCRLLQKGQNIWIFREFNAVKDLSCGPNALWDGRWALSGPEAGVPLTIAALGQEGLSACPDWRETGLPRDLLLAVPAVWTSKTLHAAPHVGKGAGWVAKLQTDETSLFRHP
ncbi:MAG: tRNA lysidine(34) synthetase TilS [Pseudomonadota bacterium]